MNVLLTLFEICGSLGLFLYGMQILSDGLQKSAGNKMKSILHFMTGNKLSSILTGLLVTVIIQSSSATTVMVVSFVNAGLMTFVESIGVIIGANIGTTVTGWIVALIGFKMDITLISLFAVALAVPMMFSKNSKLRDISGIFLGFGLLFLGLEYLQSSMPDISQHTEVLEFLSRFNDASVSSILLCVLIGTVLTMVVQSSSATMAITITMAYQGWIGIWTATALCLGQNIGTTITAYLASIGTSTHAKRSAMAHILFNVIGTVLSLIFFKPMINLVNMLTIGDIFSLQGEALNAALPTFLAGFHTLFNLINAIIFFPFIGGFAKLVEKIIPMKETYTDESYHFQYIASSRIDTPEVYMLTVKDEIGKMMNLTKNMFSTYSSIFASKEKQEVEKALSTLKKKEEYADEMQEQLIDFLVRMQQDSKTPTHVQEINSMIRTIDEIESVTDSIYNLSKISEMRIEKDLAFSEDETSAIRSYIEMTSSFISSVRKNIETGSIDTLLDASSREKDMNSRHKELSRQLHEAIQNGDGNVKTELMLLEVIRNLEHIGDYLMNIAESSFPELKHTAR